MALIQIDWNPQRQTLRTFGLIGLAAFAVFGALIQWRIGPGRIVPEGAARSVAAVLWTVGGYCGVLGAVWPRAVRPVYLLLTVITFPIGLVVSFLVMAVMYYGVITPVGLVFKITGRDSMKRRFEPDVPTYWIRRRPADSARGYFRQF